MHRYKMKATIGAALAGFAVTNITPGSGANRCPGAPWTR